MGDGIMALFGAPIAHEDHAVRACYAALAMQASVKQYAGAVQRTTGVPIQIRVGLNSGEVVVRAIGSDLHMDYTAVGQTTHLAARMEQMELPGSIVITPEVLRLAEGYVQVNALGPVSVKGLHAPLEVYEVLATGVVRSRLQAAAVRGLARFVGRGRELSHLHQALEWAGSGHGQLVALVGEPGVGKSHLVEECLHAPRTQGWLVLESRAMSYGQATPYLPVIDLLKDYCGIDASDDPPRRREKSPGHRGGARRGPGADPAADPGAAGCACGRGRLAAARPSTTPPAHHALQGAVWDKAVTYCQQAGARAFDRAAFREAVASFEQALQALAHLPEDGDTQGLALRAPPRVGKPVVPTGRV